ncbi:MAG: hypothetical protein NZZ41_05815 [Candidatus Dojkabacteria bacterium]|nr:hypothetical protein [Candidatus Dojkabacteria bacterium]
MSVLNNNKKNLNSIVYDQQNTQENSELKKYLSMLAQETTFKSKIIKGLITGTFTALGASIGFSITIAILANLISTAKNLPILDIILQETKLDVLIERELNKLNNAQQGQNEFDKITLVENDNSINIFIVGEDYVKYVTKEVTKEIISVSIVKTLKNMYQDITKNSRPHIDISAQNFLKTTRIKILTFYKNDQIVDQYLWDNNESIKLVNPGLTLLEKLIKEM